MNSDILRLGDVDDIEQRRKRLAKRLMLHRARPNLIYQYTCLSRDRLYHLRKRSNLPDTGCRRGSSPYSLAQILRSPELRDEGASAAALWNLNSHASFDPTVPKNITRLIRGEQLCTSFEAFKTLVPNTKLTLEQLALLTAALRNHHDLALAHCHTCSALSLNEPTNPKTQPPTCETCGRS